MGLILQAGSIEFIHHPSGRDEHFFLVSLGNEPLNVECHDSTKQQKEKDEDLEDNQIAETLLQN